MILYHVTSPDAVASILQNGLRANAHGKIYAITNKRFKNELGLAEPDALFAIASEGITGPIEKGGWRFYRTIRQSLIEPKFLMLVWCRKSKRPS